MPTELTIGQLAKDVGVHIETIRYYERRKLLAPTARLPSGYRLYNEDSQQRLRFIKNAQALGFTLHEIQELLDLRVRSMARCGDVRQKAEAKLKQVEAKASDLQALATALRHLVRACRSGQAVHCCQILHYIEHEQPRRTRSKKRRAR